MYLNVFSIRLLTLQMQLLVLFVKRDMVGLNLKTNVLMPLLVNKYLIYLKEINSFKL